jgi:uncharacterized membrane protein HdeD (DUF308 family)
MVRVFGGAALVVAGIAAFIEAHSHRPVPAHVLRTDAVGIKYPPQGPPHPAYGLSRTAYDLLRIGAWALVIVGALSIVVGLIGYYRRPTGAVAS